MIIKRKPIPQKSKVRAELQKEINSQCPFCENTDVGHFEIHHIDENRDNHNVSNLFLVCPTCHSRITKKDISRTDVEEKKNGLKNRAKYIEFVSAVVNEKKCSWKNDDSYNSFFNRYNGLSTLPIISFTFINHSNQTIVLKEIHTEVKRLPSGISGIPKAEVLKSLICYRVDCTKTGTIKINNPIQVPTNTAFKFDMLFFEKMHNEEIVCPQGRRVLNLTFCFSKSMSIIIPLYLNCTSEDEVLNISLLE